MVRFALNLAFLTEEDAHNFSFNKKHVAGGLAARLKKFMGVNEMDA